MKDEIAPDSVPTASVTGSSLTAVWLGPSHRDYLLRRRQPAGGTSDRWRVLGQSNMARLSAV